MTTEMNMEKFNYKAHSRTVLGDTFTPVGVYLRLRDQSAQSILMESSDYNSAGNSRSFIGICPIASIAVEHGTAVARFPDGSRESRPLDKEFTTDRAIRSFLDRFNISGDEDGYCGLYGYTSFNAVRYFEDIPVKDSTAEEHDAPDLLYILFRYTVVFKDFNNRMVLTGLAEEDGSDDLDTLLGKINRDIITVQHFKAVGEPTSTLTDEQHKENIRRCIAHCHRGDTFQIVISRRFEQRYEGDDFKLYRALRAINPSPYLFYMDFGGFRIFGSSPETHCRIEGRRAFIDPIAGTARRTGDADADRQAAERLAEDPKENAEHVMLVDLARNDLSRNCHDVHLEFYKQMQFYSHVIHLVSRVGGELDPEAEPVRTFIDTFPAGTLSGAPKVRAMQIISELEPHNRGAYGGCIGFIGMNGSLNQAITIRSFVSRNGVLWFQAGGGITAKSVEENELQEVNNKLGALRKAIISAEEEQI